ncbi:MAG: ATP synthase subunit I [Bdellovibrio bacteriovorus]
MQQSDARLVRRVLKIQAILGLGASVLALPLGGPIAFSVLIGAGSCFAANVLFAASVLRGYRAQEPERIVLRFYGAELAKIALILALFAIALVMIDGLNVPVLLVSYLVTQVASHLIAAQSDERPGPSPAEPTQK